MELAVGEVMVVQLDMAVIMILVLNLPYGDAELPCQLGSGGGNDTTAAGGVLADELPHHALYVLVRVLVRYRVIANFGLAREITSQHHTPIMSQHASIGHQNEADEIYKICSVIGSPTEFTRREGLERGSKIRYQFLSRPKVGYMTVFCSWSSLNEKQQKMVVRSSRMKLDPQE
nr:cyclin-dependent kinase F-4-like isoform X1 [Tanacetum cinerariifolium]